MAIQNIDIKLAFKAHRAKLRTIEATSKFVTEQMQQLLSFDLQSFDKRLDTWAIAAPFHKSDSLARIINKQSRKGVHIK